MADADRLFSREFLNLGSNVGMDVEIFDPPMCCSTGLCGPTIDQTLLDVNEMVLQLEKEGIKIVRYQMTTHPGAFINNPAVMRLVREKQMDALPITVVHGNVIKFGSYPTLTEINSGLNRNGK
jgi:hypothetical protein